MACNYYVKNSELLEEIKKYKTTCKYDPVTGKYIKNSAVMHDKLGRMILKIATGLGSKANFAGYTWREDMVAEAILTVIKYLHNFNPEKSNNPFAYITEVCARSFWMYIKTQKKHSHIKQELWDICSGSETEMQLFENKETIDYQALSQSRTASLIHKPIEQENKGSDDE